MRILFVGAVFLTALSFSSSLSLGQSNVSSKSETYKDLIEKSYNLGLQKDRQQAMNILISALQKENRSGPVAEIKKTLDQIAHIFFSDKAQQLFESGVSLRRTDLNQALDKLQEALRIEPDNISIVTEISRVWIAKGDCKSAQDLLSKFSHLGKSDEELRLTMAQSAFCLNKTSEYQRLSDNTNQSKKSSLAKYWLVLDIEKNINSKSYYKASELLSMLRKIDDKFPELFYWDWRHNAALRRANQDEAQKYVMACKNISANQYRQYMMDPMLCRRVVEVESETRGVDGKSE